MSRTRHGSKGPGYEYWKSRYHKYGERPGRLTKNLTHKFERRSGKLEAEMKLDHTMEFTEDNSGYQYDWGDFP